MSLRPWRLHRLVVFVSIANAAAEQSAFEVTADGRVITKPARAKSLQEAEEHGTGAVADTAASAQTTASDSDAALKAVCTRNGCTCKEAPVEESFGTGCKIVEGSCRQGCTPKWTTWDFTTSWAPEDMDDPCYKPTIECGGTAKTAAKEVKTAVPEASNNPSPPVPVENVRPPKAEQELPISTPHPQDFCRGGELSSTCPGEDEGTEGLSLAPVDEETSDPCADLSSSPSLPASKRAKCNGFHRCKLKGAKGFRQCQYKPHSSLECHSGSSCLPPCRGRQLGDEGDDCTRQTVSECLSGYVIRSGKAIQCRVHQRGNPTSGTDFCEDDHICGVKA